MGIYKYNEIMKALARGEKPFLLIPIEREDVEGMRFKLLDDFFKLVTKVGSPLRQSCAISISGYDDATDELFEIGDVKKYVNKMFHRYPYMMYYIKAELSRWLLSAWAEEVVAMRRDDHIMNAYDTVDKYGANPPQFPVHATFNGVKYGNMLRAIILHGAKINDKVGSTKIASYYNKMFSQTEGENL